MTDIKIAVADKKATLEGTPIIVCGNSDYTVTFSFDEEWSLTGPKTARFVYVKNGEKQHEDVVFEGNTAAVPVLSDVTFVRVGVFEGNLATTTPARILCTPSILCGTGTAGSPTEDVYNQLLALVVDMAEKGVFGATEEQVRQIEQNTRDIAALGVEKAGQTEMDLLAARMNTFTKLEEGSTTGDAELADIRVGADGVTYETAGDAVRAQTAGLKSALSEMESNGVYQFNRVFKCFYGSINGAGFIENNSGLTMHVAKVLPNTEYHVKGSNLYGFFEEEPAVGSTSIGGIRYEEPTLDYNLITPANANYIAFRAGENESVVVKIAGEDYKSLLDEALKSFRIGGEYAGDFDDLENNTVVNINSGSLTTVENHAPVNGFNGTVLTMCGVQNQDVIRSQIAFDGTPAANVYYRSFYTSWSKWRCLTNNAANNPMYAYSMWNVLCIGDSLTSGANYAERMGAISEVGGSIDANYPRILGRMIGANVTNGGHSGYTAENWYNRRFTEYTYTDKDTVIIWLGTNGGLTDTLESDVAPYSDFNDYANTNTGCYCKLIEAIKHANSDCLIALCTIFADTDYTETTNNVIRQIANKYDLPVIDMADLGEREHPELHLGLNNVHFGKAGNIYVANRIIETLGAYFNENPLRVEYGYTARTN